MIKVKIIEESHEVDCMQSVNAFLSTIDEECVLSVQYGSSHFQSESHQIFSFSVCIVYKEENMEE